jgi:beta-galactosidase
MKNILITLTVFCIASFITTAQYVPIPENSSVSLNGTWKFNPSPSQEIFTSTTFHHDWKDINVPGEWTMQGFEVAKGVRAAYQTTFRVPGKWAGMRIFLRFDAVYSDAVVSINGKKVFSHIGGFNVFESDITDYLKKGPNLLTIGVMNESIADTLSCGSQYAAHPLGGIPRKVTLFAVPGTYISDIFIKTDLDNEYRNAKLLADLSVMNSNKDQSGSSLHYELYSPEGKLVTSGSRAVTAGEHISLIELDINDPSKWNAEYPNLYRFRIVFASKSGEETIERKVGFRKLEIAGNQLFVNGIPVKLHGVNRHEVHPLLGRSLNMDLWKKDVALYKNANINYIRTSHYPPAEEFISLCDSVGFYVELENPLVWVGQNSNLLLDVREAWDIRLRKELVKTTRETVTFYRNHPAIIIWSLANESAWTDNWKAALDKADSLDPTRPKSFHDQAYGFYNNYGSSVMPVANIHYPGPEGPSIADTFSRPLLFGEYCHLNTYNRQEIATDPGVRDAWAKGFHDMWEKMYRARGCLGGAIWSGIDDAFMLPDGRLVGYGEWGPIDGWRRMKPEYYHIKKTYSPVIISNRKVSLTDKGEILLQVENRFDFTDLKDCRFEYDVAGLEGSSSLNVAPHNSGILRLGPFDRDLDGKILHVRAYSPYGRLIDESSVQVGHAKPDIFPFDSPAVGTAVKMTDDGAIIRIMEDDIAWVFDKSEGKLAAVISGTDTIMNGGAELMILPLRSEECKTEHSLNIPVLNNTCSQWKPESVVSARSGDTVRIEVKGSYKEAGAVVDYCFARGGMLLVKYSFISSGDVNPRQVGLVFSVPRSSQTLLWYRKGYWSSYPGWHIGRVSGKAVPFPENVYCLKKVGLQPEGEWRFDANALGCNDFRSTKADIYWAALTNTAGKGIAVISGGKQAFRSWVNGNSVNFLVADYSNGGAEIFFASHLESERRQLKKGDKFEGAVTLKIVREK